MNTISHIGKCKGCNKSSSLDDGVCTGCLKHPKRGRRWAEMSDRIRRDPSFMLKAFNEIGVQKPENELAGKMLFIRMYGVPTGAVLSLELRVLLDSSNASETVEDSEGPRRNGLRLVK